MATDNTVLSPGSGGETFPSLADGSGINWPIGGSAYPTTISPNANILQIVDLAHGLPVQPDSAAVFPISAASLPLPTGAATSAKQDSQTTLLTTIADGTPTLVGGLVPVLLSGQTGSVTVTLSSTTITGTVAVTQSGTWNITNISGTISLPTGAATESTLSTLNGKITACDTGSVTISAALPAGTNLLGSIEISDGTNILFTSPHPGYVQGSVTANAGTNLNTSLLALDSTLTGGTQKTLVYDGTNTIFTSSHPGYVQGTVTANAGTNLNTSLLALENGGNLAKVAGAIYTDNSNSVTGIQILGYSVGDGKPEALQVDDDGDLYTRIRDPLPSGTNLIGYANPQNPAATTGTISAADSGTTTTPNSNGQSITTGTPTANSSVVAAVNANSGISIQLKGTSITSVTLVTERSIDGGTTYVPFSTELVSVGPSSSTWTITDNNANVLRGNVGEMTYIRVRCTSLTGTSVAVTIQPGYGISQVIANQGPPNSNSYPWTVSTVAATSGGVSPYRNFQTSGAVIADVIKASAGQLYGLECYNVSASAVYVRLYNKASTPGTGDTPVWSGIIPGNTAGAGFVKGWPNGMTFSTGIAIRVTAAIADNDNTALTANTVMVNGEYK